MARRKRSDDRMLLVPGETVIGRAGKYVVDAVVGSGSYATVYVAKDSLGRKVALKEYVPASTPREVPLLQSLFERERFVLSLVSPHPMMPAFYDGFESDQHYYLAQEFIEGKSLDDVIYKTKLNNDWMLRWAASLCYALSYLHNLSIVHHDLKPANIRIRPNGRLCLLDFGAARYFGQNNSLVPESFTEDKELYGTEGYLPPEIETDGNFTADVRTDIFALGCILYEMVMGEPPAQKQINERMSFITTPLMARKDVNLDYVKLITKALSYNTDYRYASAQIFLDAIKPITPPFVMISTKQLAFGRLDVSAGPLKRKFTIYNGGNSEISGDVQSKSPWLTVEMPQFRGQKRDMVVVADPGKIKERNALVHGIVEVFAAEKRDSSNHVISPAERLYIDCSIVVAPSPAKIAIAPPVDDDGAHILRIRKGMESSVSLTVQNLGETTAEIKVSVPDGVGLTVAPDKLTLVGESTAKVTLTVAATDDVRPDATVPVTLTVSKGQKLEVNVLVRSSKPAGGILSIFKR
jgi:serine/threonine protein kinase